jgi:hypothetical protein
MPAWGSSIGWPLRGLVAAVLVLTAVPAYQLPAFAALQVNDPEAAYRLQPGDVLAAGTVLASRLAEGAELQLDPGDLRMALLNRPLSADLIAMQGLLLDTEGKLQQAQGAMQLASQVSRRSAPANLWLIETALAAGDVSRAVVHYHAALAVHTKLEKPLLSILSAGITFPEVRTALQPYLKQPTRWTGAFLDEVSRQPDVADVAALLDPLPKALLAEDYRARLAAIMHRLAVERAGGAAARMARQVIPGFAPQSLSKLELSAETRDKRLGALAWSFRGNERIAVNVGADQVLEVTAQPLSRGEVASRDLLVEGGRSYVLAQRVALGSDAGKVGLRWSAACVSKQGIAPFWEQLVPASREAVRYRSVVKVPNGCTVARFTVHVVGPDGQLAAIVSVGELALELQP